MPSYLPESEILTLLTHRKYLPQTIFNMHGKIPGDDEYFKGIVEELSNSAPPSLSPLFCHFSSLSVSQRRDPLK